MLNNELPAPEDLDRRVATFLAGSGEAFSGAYLVAINGSLRLRGARGLANREFEVPNEPSTRFRIGSITKQFTAAVMVLLAEEKLIALDDSISHFFPETNNRWRDITLRMLLCHRSGVPSYTSLQDFSTEISKIDRTPLEVVELVRELPLDFVPGSRALYSNTGYTLLGCVIEQVCAQSYAGVLTSRLFEPLGMADTGYDNGFALVTSLANGYFYDEGGWLRAPHIAMSLPFAAGGLYSTVDDLARWHCALYEGALLHPDSRSAMFADYGDGMGFGIMVKQTKPLIRFHAHVHLAGTWTLVAADVQHPDGTRTHDYGGSPEGMLMVDNQYHYSLQIFKAERKSFPTADKSNGDDVDYKSAVMGSSTHYGTISVDLKDLTLTFHIEDSSFPNWKGESQKRSFTLTKAELSYLGVPRPNGDVPISVWRRVQ